MLLIGNAIDAFQDVPEKVDNGHRMLHNDWFTGPFYAWDQNFLRFASDDYQKKNQ